MRPGRRELSLGARPGRAPVVDAPVVGEAGRPVGLGHRAFVDELATVEGAGAAVPPLAELLVLPVDDGVRVPRRVPRLEDCGTALPWPVRLISALALGFAGLVILALAPPAPFALGPIFVWASFSPPFPFVAFLGAFRVHPDVLNTRWWGRQGPGLENRADVVTMISELVHRLFQCPATVVDQVKHRAEHLLIRIHELLQGGPSEAGLWRPDFGELLHEPFVEHFHGGQVARLAQGEGDPPDTEDLLDR